MLESIRAIEMQPEHQEELFALLRRHFGAWSTERLAKRWEWQCGTGNPWKVLRSKSGLITFDNGSVVGGVVRFPVPWRVKGERVIFLSGGDFAIDQPYRMRAFPQLSRAFMSTPHVMATGLHPTLWKTMLRMGGILLPMSQARFTLHLRNRGWICRAARRHLPEVLGCLASPTTTGRLLASQPVEAVMRRFARSKGPPPVSSVPRTALAADVRPLARFGDKYNTLWEKARQRFRLTLDKDAEYLNWRYLDCPTFRYPILRGLYRDGKLSCVVIAGAYTVLDSYHRPCGTNGEILELITHDASAQEIEALVLSVCWELNRRGVDKIGVTACYGTAANVFGQIGFRPEQDKRFDSLIVLDPDISRRGCVESAEGVYITSGDGDMLNAFLI